jgi:hypothetical protein
MDTSDCQEKVVAVASNDGHMACQLSTAYFLTAQLFFHASVKPALLITAGSQ